MHSRDDRAVPCGFGAEVRSAQRENCGADALSEKLGNFPIAKGLGKFREPFKRSEEHTSELQSRFDLVCRLLLEKKKNTKHILTTLISITTTDSPLVSINSIMTVTSY